MGILILGLAVFIGLHLIPAVPALRTALIGGFGESKYRFLFSLVAFVGLAIIVWGYSSADFRPVYEPAAWGRSLAFGLVPIALILFAAANMPTHIRAIVRHPMLAGLFLWALVHLAANGDLRSVLLFGALGVYAVVATISAVMRTQQPSESKPPRWSMDAAAVVAGVVVAGLLAKFHGTLFGMPLM